MPNRLELFRKQEWSKIIKAMFKIGLRPDEELFSCNILFMAKQINKNILVSLKRVNGILTHGLF